MTRKMPDPANTNAPVSPVNDDDLDQVQGGGDHRGEKLFVSTPDAEAHIAKHKPREIVVVGSKVKEVVHTPG